MRSLFTLHRRGSNMIGNKTTRSRVLPAAVMTLALVGAPAASTSAAGQAVHTSPNRVTGVSVRSTLVDLQPRAAFATIGTLRLGGTAHVDGRDSFPAAWRDVCGAPGPDLPGILIDDLSEISEAGNTHAVEGDPPRVEDPNLTPRALLALGQHAWADLVAQADFRFPGGATVREAAPDSILMYGSYSCHTDYWLNWGDPENPEGVCGDHFPVIYASGDLRIEGKDRGQGILLVEGNLTVTGGFEFFGPVIVKGAVSAEGAGVRFVGGLVAANASLGQSTVQGNVAVEYSSCSVARAVGALAPQPSPTPTSQGSTRSPGSVR
jgi:hypothetical protein